MAGDFAMVAERRDDDVHIRRETDRFEALRLARDQNVILALMENTLIWGRKPRQACQKRNGNVPDFDRAMYLKLGESLTFVTQARLSEKFCRQLAKMPK